MASDRVEHPVGLGAVLYGDRSGVKRIQGRRDLWHVTDVLESQRNGDRWFRLWDGTHTEMVWCHEDDLLADFAPAGWTWPTGRKPLYHLTRECGVEDGADLMTDGGVDRPEHQVAQLPSRVVLPTVCECARVDERHTLRGWNSVGRPVWECDGCGARRTGPDPKGLRGGR